MLQLDHIFIITEPDAPVATELQRIGMREGTSNTHPGQGTANRRFFLNGITIELIFINDADEAENGAGKHLGILKRSRDIRSSPFGIIVRVPTPEHTPGFPNWQYFPDYFNGKLCFYVGANSDILHEPLCICMPPSLPKAANLPIELTNPDWVLSSVEVCTPVSTPSPALQCFEKMEQVKLSYNLPHQLSLTFNNGAKNQSKDLSAAIPVLIRW